MGWLIMSIGPVADMDEQTFCATALNDKFN